MIRWREARPSCIRRAVSTDNVGYTMRKTLRCGNCNLTLVVVGPDSRREKLRVSPVTCPKCRTVNEVQWPSDTGFSIETEGVYTAEP